MLGEPIELGVEVIVVLDRFGIERDPACGSGRFERGDEVVEGHAVDGDGIRGEEVDAEVRGRLSHPCDKRSEGLGGEIAARDEGESTGPSNRLGEFGRRRPTGHGRADNGQRGLHEGDRHGSLLALGRNRARCLSPSPAAAWSGMLIAILTRSSEASMTRSVDGIPRKYRSAGERSALRRDVEGQMRFLTSVSMHPVARDRH